MGRSSFVLLVLGLLGGGLVCLLVVNTTLAANSMKITNLQQSNAASSEQVQELEQRIAAEQSAAALEKKALRLGMRPDPALVFVDLLSRSIRIAPSSAVTGAVAGGAVAGGGSGAGAGAVVPGHRP
ncbi:MAG TPA: hypothetical protein VNF47_28240 [Streptosporangiaceae bacterium]|nr:hypothetical protein [Streptosporangiaceae bacterium]